MHETCIPVRLKVPSLCTLGHVLMRMLHTHLLVIFKLLVSKQPCETAIFVCFFLKHQVQNINNDDIFRWASIK